MNKNKGIKKNSAQCSNCKDILISKHIHDWVACSCWKHGTGIFVDGGNEYLRRGWGEDGTGPIELSEYYEEE